MKKKKLNILVTGCAGFIGSTLSKNLIKNNSYNELKNSQLFH